MPAEDLNGEMNTTSAVELQLQGQRMQFDPLWTKFKSNRILHMDIC